MTQTTGTISDLIQTAISIERATEALYRRFAVLFRDTPDVAAFWTRYAAEESGHARWMENLQARVSPEVLERPADPKVWEMARRTAGASLEPLPDGIHTLFDAYELANEIEHGETNAIFEFLIRGFSEDERAVQFLRIQLHAHVGALLQAFPERYRGAAARKAVRAAGDGSAQATSPGENRDGRE